MHSQGLQQEPAGEPRPMKYASGPTKRAQRTEEHSPLQQSGVRLGEPREPPLGGTCEG